MNASPTSNRLWPIDLLRTLAVWLMIFFHTAYDLKLFGKLDIDFQNDLFWWFLPRLIVTLFLLCAGMGSVFLSERPHFWHEFWVRMAKVVMGAAIISISTYLLYPKHWIYFGTLHCIALCSLAGVPLQKKPLLALVLGAALSFGALANFPFWWPLMDHKSLDYIPFLPWFGVYALGIAAGHALQRAGQWVMRSPLSARWYWPGQHSLIIYLLHQPIIFGLLWIMLGQKR